MWFQSAEFRSSTVFEGSLGTSVPSRALPLEGGENRCQENLRQGFFDAPEPAAEADTADACEALGSRRLVRLVRVPHFGGEPLFGVGVKGKTNRRPFLGATGF